MATRKKKAAPKKRKPAPKKKAIAKKKKPAPKKKPVAKKTVAKKKKAPVKKPAPRVPKFDPERTQQLSFTEILGDIEERQALDKLEESK